MSNLLSSCRPDRLPGVIVKVALLCLVLSACSEAPLQTDPAVEYANEVNSGGPVFKSGFAEVGAQRFHYVEAGAGPLMLFYHGFPSYWFSFYHQMVEFSREYRVVAIDGLGANLSSKPDDLAPYAIENLARQLDAVARQLAGDAPFVLVGHDWGGALAWAFAQRYPERLTQVIGISAPPYNQFLELLRSNERQQSTSSYMFDMRGGYRNFLMTLNGGYLVWRRGLAGLRESGRLNAREDALFKHGLARPGAIDAGINWYRANIPRPQEIGPADYWPSRTARVEVPGLLIWGERDTAFVDVFIDELPNYVTQLSVERLPDVGHWPTLQSPTAVNQAMRRFLQQ
ncbi:alpha/beta hydrolase [Exilibacterium tricleocarpae]|uniref:Alpha/beta hydrolase n=1 Tax=Exilibacterium tricleocarpae TaxID=2591008 RepID=A0A545U3G8_9GAMM|nr:alpha/beta hydrolase [Exilibacterium tricleocarpae]TQV84022.1 alpha/beta hydrolase [Exilibacterium tricleocarpae]